MTYATAAQLTEIFLALSFIQQGLEHLVRFRQEQILFGARIVLSVLLIAGLAAPGLCLV